MSWLCRRAAVVSLASMRRAPQPAFARSTLVSRVTSASISVAPALLLAVVVGAGAGELVGAGAVGRRVVVAGAGAAERSTVEAVPRGPVVVGSSGGSEGAPGTVRLSRDARSVPSAAVRLAAGSALGELVNSAVS